MPFTTLQDRKLVIERQPVPGSQFQRKKFNLGEVHRILPPVGSTSINCQGIDIPAEGKRIQITKEIVALIQAGFVRIAHDLDEAGPGDQPSGVASSQKADDVVDLGRDHHVDVSSLDLKGGATGPSLFSSLQEIRGCNDNMSLAQFIESKTGYPANRNLNVDELRDIAERLFVGNK